MRSELRLHTIQLYHASSHHGLFIGLMSIIGPQPCDIVWLPENFGLSDGQGKLPSNLTEFMLNTTHQKYDFINRSDSVIRIARFLAYKREGGIGNAETLVFFLLYAERA